jgi:LETM1 and EF-hand domain-containing protein 1, mitochondrial
LLTKTLSGSTLSRRERKQLLRTVSDLFRLVPFSMFIIIPFMEFALPFALRLFPNMLPSTYQDSLKAEENMKRELQSRIAMAQFFQETLSELAKEQKRKATKRKQELMEAGELNNEEGTTSPILEIEDSAASMLEFLEKARKGEPIPPDVIIRYSNYFQDDLTLDNMPRMQLINMCKYMSIPPYGSDAFLRFQLRHRIRVLKEDDQRILWEGIDSLTKMELREACQERGMRSTGLSKDAYKAALQQWLNLSVNRNVPISLLVMSRTFFLRDERTDVQKADDGTDVSGLADAISGLDKEVLNEVLLEVATAEEKTSDPEIRKLKLEVLSQQNERIREEQEERKAAAKKKSETAEKQKDDQDQASISSILSTTDAAPVFSSSTLITESTSSTSTPPTLESTFSDIAATSDVVLSKEATSVTKEAKGEQETKEDHDFSPQEMEALSDLLSNDPVSKERAELERIKSLMLKDKKIVEEEGVTKPRPAESVASDVGLTTAQMKDGDKQSLLSAEKEIEKFTVEIPSSTAEVSHIVQDDISQEKEYAYEDPVVARLKKRLESMVDKIEVQMSDVKAKIGSKLHLLDKDQDGILSRTEMAEVLQQVFKRKVTLEEAMEVASDIVS